MNDHDPSRELLPQKGWLGEYVRLTDGLSACPRFRFFAALCTMGAAINNKVSIQRGTTGTLFPKFFPNPWVILLAPPGRGYKTSTINMACNCLSKSNPEVRIIADKITPEAIVNALSAPATPKELIRIGPRDATGLIKAPELSVFFGKSQYNQSLVSLITDLYDYRETWTAETIGRGKNTLKNNCLSILGGSTPAWLQQMLPQDAFTGGFMSRFIIVEMPPNYYLRRAFPTEPPYEEWANLLDWLGRIGRISQDAKWANEESRSYYQQVYEGYKPSGDVQLDAYKEREAEQMLRVGMLLAISEDTLDVAADHLHMARQLLNSLEAETNPRIERLATHPRMALTQEILDLLRAHNPEPISETDLLKRLYRQLTHGETQFYEAIHVLKKTGQIDVLGSRNDYKFCIRRKK